MNDLLFPVVAKTGKTAFLEVTTRESGRRKATLNVRLALPRRTLAVTAPDGRTATLPPSPDENTGLPLAQMEMGLN